MAIVCVHALLMDDIERGLPIRLKPRSFIGNSASMQLIIIQNLECCSDELSCCLSAILDLKSGNGKTMAIV